MYRAHERANAIDSVCKYIFKKQYSFFLTGDKAKILALSQEELSKYINRDRSSVSRLIQDKYIDTPQGIIPLKILISARGSTAKQVVVEKAIQEEDRSNPLSDKQLSKIIEETIGVKFSYQSVKKLRGKLKICGKPTRRRNYISGK